MKYYSLMYMYIPSIYKNIFGRLRKAIYSGLSFQQADIRIAIYSRLSFLVEKTILNK